MKYLIPRSTKHFAGLALVDGSNWDIIAADDRAYDVVLDLAKVMQLQSHEKRIKKNLT